MECKCIECGKQYTYNDEVGYSKELCGALCDGLRSGKRRSNNRIAQLEADNMRLRGRFDETEIYTLYSMVREKVSETEKLNDANATAYYERIWSKLGDMLEEARADQQAEGG